MSRQDGKYSVGRTNMTSVGGEKWHTGYDVVVVKKPTALPPHSLGLLLSLSLSESYIIRKIMDIDYYSIYWDLCGYWDHSPTNSSARSARVRQVESNALCP